MNADSLRRDDLKPVTSLDLHPPAVRAALRRAAKRGTANLPVDIGENWIHVDGRQVAFKSLRAWRF